MTLLNSQNAYSLSFAPRFLSLISISSNLSSEPSSMSDFGDDMDIDEPINDSIIFNSDNTNAKGKRSAANLPVEAEDSLPW